MRKLFYRTFKFINQLEDFVNDVGIKQKDIQSIFTPVNTPTEERFTLIFWKDVKK